MPASHPAPDAEDIAEHDIDERAASRNIRVILTVMSVVLLLPLLGFLAYGVFGPRPVGVHRSPSGWLVVIFMAVIGITFAAMVLVLRRQYRRPGYRRLLQYGWQRRRRVSKDLRRGRPLSEPDMLVAAALVGQLRTQGKRQVICYFLLLVVYLLNVLNHPGSQRWLWVGFAACWLVLIPLALRQQRQMIRNYERMNRPTVDGHHDDAAPEVTG